MTSRLCVDIYAAVVSSAWPNRSTQPVGSWWRIRVIKEEPAWTVTAAKTEPVSQRVVARDAPEPGKTESRPPERDAYARLLDGPDRSGPSVIAVRYGLGPARGEEGGDRGGERVSIRRF